MRLKTAGGDSQAGITQTLSEALVQLFSLVGRGRVGKRRAIASTTVAIQGELRNHQDFASGFRNRSVHFSPIVVEDAEEFDLVGESIGIVLAVFFPYAQKYAQAGADCTDNFLCYGDARLGNSLNYDAHGMLDIPRT